MPITIEAGYEKKLDLPRRFCNQSFFLSVRVEVPDGSDVDAEGARLHKKLQRCVDRQLKKVGYFPGEQAPPKPAPRRRSETFEVVNGGLEAGKTKCAALLSRHKEWTCDDAQKEMILALVAKYGLKKTAVEDMAKASHGVGVRALDREKATAFIEEIVRTYHNEEPPTRSEA